MTLKGGCAEGLSGRRGVTPIWRTVVALGVMDRLKHGRQGKLDPFSPVADRSQHHR